MPDLPRVVGLLAGLVLATVAVGCRHTGPTIDLSCDRLEFDPPNPRDSVVLRVGATSPALAQRGLGQLDVHVSDLADSGTVVSDAVVGISRDSLGAWSRAQQLRAGLLALEPGRVFVRVWCRRCHSASTAVTIVAGRTDTLIVRVARAHPVCD